MINMSLSWQTFEQVDMRVGRVTQVWEASEVRKPSYWLTIDFGPEIGVRQSSAAIRDFYHKPDLVGRLVVAVVNFEPKQVGKHLSQALVLAAVLPDGRLSLLRPDGEVELGARIA
jgi:tRNA-binding protein